MKTSEYLRGDDKILLLKQCLQVWVRYYILTEMIKNTTTVTKLDK